MTQRISHPGGPVLPQERALGQGRRPTAAVERARERAAAGDPGPEAVLEALDAPVLVFDVECRPVRANAAAREMLGADPVALGTEAFRVHLLQSLRLRVRGGPTPGAGDPAVARALRGEIVRDLPVEFTDAAGRVRTVSIAARPLQVDGRIAGAVVVWHEITGRLAAEEAARAKDEFLAMLGHELRNPLAPILTAVQILAVRAGENPARELAVIERQARHMARLVDDLLDVAKIIRGTVKLEKTALDLRAVMTSAVEVASPLIEERAHELELSVPEGLRLEGDEERLVQVFSNLLTNAAKYSPAHGRITVRAERAAGAVRVSVADRGNGIAPDLLPEIFDLFVQGDRRLDRAPSGLGLGLALVRALTHAHGGRVEARSAGPGQGSEFVVELPLGPPPPAASRPDAEPGTPSDRRRVLVVDDNRDAAELLAEGLRLHGHEVQVAFDGPGALEAAAELDPEVALLDIGLPVMNGYELARRLRERGTRCHLVAVTGYGQEADRLRARENGFDSHVVKPVDLDRIRELVLRAGRA